jgi:hypothetical protein
MKKAFSILFIFVVLFSGMTIRYSAHYCQGTFIASKLSLSGKNASCGMTHENSGGKDVHFSNVTCENEISSYTFSDNYIHAPQAPDAGKSLTYVDSAVLINPAANLTSLISSLNFRQLPPGTLGTPKYQSEVLCVFRI